jgi:hypothetical protein
MLLTVTSITFLLLTSEIGVLRPVVGGNFVDLALSCVIDAVETSLSARLESGATKFIPFVSADSRIWTFLSNARSALLERLYGDRYGQEQQTLESVPRTECEEHGNQLEDNENESSWYSYTAQNATESFRSEAIGRGCDQSKLYNYNDLIVPWLLLLPFNSHDN